MPEVCGENHPDRPEVTCEKPRPCHTMHLSRTHRLDWDGPPPPTRRSRKAEAAEIANKATPAVRTGPPTLTAEPVVRTRPDDEWVEYATGVFHRFLRTRTEPFTTPEDLWPLLEAPQEMRHLVHVVRRALKQGWMAEVAAKRITDPCRTKDGTWFSMNKLVPVYESRIAERPER